MSATAIVWILTAVVLTLLSLRRPVWAIGLYMQTFFAAPQLWWWGDELPEMRYALWAGVGLLIATLVARATSHDDAGHRVTRVHKAAIVMCINASLVHVLFAVDRVISIETYVELLKFCLLFCLIWAAIKDKADFRTAVMSIAVGGFYIGWEVTVNERGDFSGSRLEGVGAPGADTANSLASLMLTCLPLISSLLVDGKKRHKVIAIIAAPLVLNVLLLCNSRGAFLGLIGTAIAFLLIARGNTRKQAIRSLAFGSVALFLLLGDPKILDRFTTTFVGSEQRDNSAESRLVFWEAGFRMLNDYPLGAGGNAFKYNLGRGYQAAIVGDDAAQDRSLHNGYLTEATDWGFQGLIVKLAMFAFALLAAFRTEERARRDGRTSDALTGLCIMTAGIGLLIHCMFGSFLASEWAYWVMALLIRYSELYAVGQQVAEQPVRTPLPALQGGPQAA
jgi:putative inorganic carbon (hco3(-)) transporter